MTSASNARKQRRAAAKAPAPDLSEAPKAIITITEVPGTGGFTIGLGLHGARMDELHPGEKHPISIVDVIALAVTHTIRSQPKDFQDSVALVNDTLRNVNTRLEAGEPIEEAMAGADEALEGAIADIEDFAPEAANA
jgi:hypothetical protein